MLPVKRKLVAIGDCGCGCDSKRTAGCNALGPGLEKHEILAQAGGRTSQCQS